jgi:hypothetical protein
MAGPEGAFWFRRASRKQQRKMLATLSGSRGHGRVPRHLTTKPTITSEVTASNRVGPLVSLTKAESATEAREAWSSEDRCDHD